MKQLVYFIQSGKNGPIKIGKTKDLSRRLHGLQTGSCERLRLLATNEKLSEEHIHNFFSDLRIRGEWFEPSKILLDFIKNKCEVWESWETVTLAENGREYKAFVPVGAFD